MFPKAVSVEVVRPYVIDVTFDDGARRTFDLEPQLRGEVFEPLRDPEQFAQAYIDADWGTVSWPSGADLSPELLHETSTLRQESSPR